MQIVINIPDEQYNDIIEHYNTFPNEWKKWGLQAIKDGVPLPKGHGDLIDRGELLKLPIDKANYPSNYVKYAATIIETDRSEEHG